MPLPERTDVAVIGAGYAGLSVALELARNGIGVTVIEKGAFGSGASTRNGGAVSPEISVGRGLSGGRNQADDFLRAAAESFDHLDAIIQREGIACHWQKHGRFVGAHTRKHYASFAALADTLNRVTGAGATLIPEDRRREELRASTTGAVSSLNDRESCTRRSTTVDCSRLYAVRVPG